MNMIGLRAARMLAAVVLAPALAHAAALRLNSPYPCGEDLTLTVTACGPVNGQTFCMIKLDKDGRTLRQSGGLEQDVAKLINKCAAHVGGAPVSSGASAPPNPAYLAEFPSVEKIQSLVKGTNPDDTLARRLAILTYLPQMIDTMRVDTRSYNSPKTPDEVRILQAYSLAAYRISQSYAKSHTAAATSNFQHLEGHYEFDSNFYHAWWPTLFPADLRASYNHMVAGDFAALKAHAQQEVQAQQQAREQSAGNGGFGAGNDHGGRDEGRKCLESGRSEMECFGEALTASLSDLTGGALKRILPETPLGLRLTGVYASADLQLAFEQSKAFLRCGTLEPQQLQYTIERRGPQLLVSLPTSPNPLLLSYRVSGDLAGPPAIEVAGRVVTGPAIDHPTTVYETHTDYDSSDPYVSHSHTSSYVVHHYTVPTAPKTESCSAGALAPTGQTLRTANILTQLLGTSASQSQNTAPGLRLNGTYASSGGLKIEFRGDSATLECGAAHHSEGYAVHSQDGQMVVRFQNDTGPLALTLGSDGALVSAGRVTVAGRTISGEGADGQPLYTPTSASCTIGTLTAAQ